MGLGGTGAYLTPFSSSTRSGLLGSIFVDVDSDCFGHPVSPPRASIFDAGVIDRATERSLLAGLDEDSGRFVRHGISYFQHWSHLQFADCGEPRPGGVDWEVRSFENETIHCFLLSLKELSIDNDQDRQYDKAYLYTT